MTCILSDCPLIPSGIYFLLMHTKSFIAATHHYSLTYDIINFVPRMCYSLEFRGIYCLGISN